MPDGTIVYRDEREPRASVSRREFARLLAPIVPELFAEVFNAGKHPDDAELMAMGQQWDIRPTDVAAYNVDDLCFIVLMSPGPDGRHEARREELRRGLAAKLLDVIEEQSVDVRQYIKTIQVDIRFQVMSGLVVKVKGRQIEAAWGNTTDTDLKGTTIPTAS